MNEMQEIDTRKAIVLRNGIVKWVAPERADSLAEALASENPPKFVMIDETTVAIHEIQSVLTRSAYDDLTKVKQGMYQCSYRTWHAKREECSCAREASDRREAHMKRIRDTEQQRPITPEQRAGIAEMVARTRQELLAKGVIHHKTGRGVLKRSALVEYERKHGRAYDVQEGTTIDEEN